MSIKGRGWEISVSVLFAVIVSIFLSSITVFALDSPSPDTIILLGRVQVEWDGYAGKRQTDSSDFEILIKRTVVDPVELTEIYEVKPDVNGYFAVIDLPREGAYGFSKVKVENGSILVSIDIFRPVSNGSRVLDLGMMTLTVEGDGKIGVEIKGAGFTATTTSIISQENSFIHTYFINNFDLKDWLFVVKSDLQKKIKARKLDKEIKQLREQADKFKQEEEFEAAVRKYQKILEQDPNNGLVIKDLVKCLKTTSLSGEVIMFFCEQITKTPQEKGLYYGLAQCFAGLGRYDQAVKIYSKVLLIDPDDGWAKRELRKLSSKISEPVDKSIFFEDVAQQLPDDELIYSEQKAEDVRFAPEENDGDLEDGWRKRFPPSVYLRFDGLEKAEAVYLKKLYLFPDYLENYRNQVDFYIESEGLAQSGAALNETGQKYLSEKRSFFRLGDLYQNKRDFTQFTANYKAIYNLQPHKDSLLTGLAESYNEPVVMVYQKTLDLESVGSNHNCEPADGYFKALKKGVEDDPTNAAYHAALAEYYTGCRLLDEAVKHYQLAVNNDLQNDYRLRILADAWLRLGNNEKAENALLAARKMKPDSVLSVNKLALFYESSQNVKVAEGVLLQAVRDYPVDLDLLLSLVRFFERQGEFEKALIECRKALKIDDKNIDAYNLLGHIYKKMGYTKDALHEFALGESVLRRKIAEEPQEPAHYSAFACFLADENINLDEALLMAQKSVALKMNKLNLETLGWVYYQRGEYERAVEFMNEAIAKGGDQANYFFRLSMALSRVAKKAEARAAFETGKFKEPCNVLGLRAAKILAQKRSQ